MKDRNRRVKDEDKKRVELTAGAAAFMWNFRNSEGYFTVSTYTMLFTN